jgi:hypothetical protein
MDSEFTIHNDQFTIHDDQFPPALFELRRDLAEALRAEAGTLPNAQRGLAE